jgi:hypothetical protein
MQWPKRQLEAIAGANGVTRRAKVTAVAIAAAGSVRIQPASALQSRGPE